MTVARVESMKNFNGQAEIRSTTWVVLCGDKLLSESNASYYLFDLDELGGLASLSIAFYLDIDSLCADLIKLINSAMA